MKYFKKIEGERLYLSPINEEDVETYVKWMNDFSVTDGLGTSHNITTIYGEKDWIQNTIKSNDIQLAIVKKENNTLIGNCSLHQINHYKKTSTLGIFIGEEQERNKGYGTETVKLLMKYGFEYLNLNNIMLQVYSFNKRAIKSYKKAGFKEFGRRHNVITIKNKLYDEIYMEILKEDYFK